MRHHYDIYEKFLDGSNVWRGYVPGWYEAELKMHELAGRSKNQFYAFDIEADRVVAPGVRGTLGLRANALANGQCSRRGDEKTGDRLHNVPLLLDKRSNSHSASTRATSPKV